MKWIALTGRVEFVLGMNPGEPGKNPPMGPPPLGCFNMLRFLAIILLACSSVWGADEPLPSPPAGFSWQRLASIKGALLKPDGWFFKASATGGTEGFFITKENIDKDGAFKTGLSLNCMRDIPKHSGLTPSGYAVAFADAAAEKHRLLERSARSMGPFNHLRLRYVDAPPGKESVTIWNLLVANDKTGTLYLYVFEAPTSTWEEAWKTGNVILKMLLLDDEI